MSYEEARTNRKPKGCAGGVYIPWVCGTCDLKRKCKPRSVTGCSVRAKAAS